MSRHTPGPWVVAHTSDRWVDIRHASGSAIASATTARTEAEANARLVAAAPELFEALSALVEVNEKWNAAVEAFISRPPNWNDAYLDAARAALAKARGES